VGSGERSGIRVVAVGAGGEAGGVASSRSKPPLRLGTTASIFGVPKRVCPKKLSIISSVGGEGMPVGCDDEEMSADEDAS
jgi:hypothetical protein